MCTGDMGFGQAEELDLEIWSAGQEQSLEVSSIPMTFQPRRTRTRYRPAGEKKVDFVHTLNGSALALPRTVPDILENNQRSDGTIDVPPVLQPYFGGSVID